MRLRLLLRPAWLLSALVVITFATACFTLLAPWQFERHAERQETNAAVQASFEATPVPLTEVLAADAAPNRTTEWRLVTAVGEFLPDEEAVARLRTVQGAAAFEVLTPFRLLDGTTVLVDRGFVRPGEGVSVPDFAPPPTGQVEITGRVRVGERDPENRPAFTEGGHLHVYSIDPQVVLPGSRPGYVQLEAGSPGVLGPLPLPQLEAGPSFSYALQWIAFGAMTLIGLVYFTWREVKPGGALDKPRRKSVAEILAEDEAATAAAAR
ncbi:SURF1 family cytochrome oxidase biogenesis protein [Actinokineospora fastidiosa]|uniref:SURF1 family cytochrome oxidase biogenesis protein n=1 Tax=Actinokineospora fastidiosa TaxID=1816 RepID=UPI001670D050|nr:SURF1 family cytochrome oxidase biogenesis protein [Actinokineospora fastidiosa]